MQNHLILTRMLDLGVEAVPKSELAQLGYNFDFGLRLYLAGGPTLPLADMETSSSGHHKNELEFNWGLYVAGGASYWFTERVGIAAEVRYDDGFGTVGTRYVKQSLDTLGGSVKLLVRF